MRTSETISAIASALAKAQGKFGPILKKKKAELGKGGQYSYADMADVCEELIPILSECGISTLQGSSVENPSFLQTRIVHGESGEWIETDTQMFEGRNGGSQGYGSGMTYARRYGLLALVGAAPEDDGGKAASGPGARPAHGQNPFSTEQAWIDAVKDKLPEGYSARDLAEAVAEQLITDFRERKSSRGVNGIWNKHERVITWLADKHADLHANLLDAFSARLRALDEEATEDADGVPA